MILNTEVIQNYKGQKKKKASVANRKGLNNKSGFNITKNPHN